MLIRYVQPQLLYSTDMHYFFTFFLFFLLFLQMQGNFALFGEIGKTISYIFPATFMFLMLFSNIIRIHYTFLNEKNQNHTFFQTNSNSIQKIQKAIYTNTASQL